MTAPARRLSPLGCEYSGRVSPARIQRITVVKPHLNPELNLTQLTVNLTSLLTGINTVQVSYTHALYRARPVQAWPLNRHDLDDRPFSADSCQCQSTPTGTTHAIAMCNAMHP
jgi:hypothetical protein